MRYANLLYQNRYQPVFPSDERLAKPEGRVTVLGKKDFAAWVAARTEKPTVLTWNNAADTFGCHRMNMGESKGLTLGDVAIFATGEMKKWIQDESVKLKDATKAKLYVALTRASGDLCLVIDGHDSENRSQYVFNAMDNDRSHSSRHALCYKERAGNAEMMREKCPAFYRR